MIIINRQGLTEAQRRKVAQPYARNSGAPVDFSVAAKEADDFLDENPTLLKEVTELLNKAG